MRTLHVRMRTPQSSHHQEVIYYKVPFAIPVAMYGALAFVMFRNRKANEGEGGGKP